MKLVVWAYPLTAINIQLVNSFDQPVDDVPIEEQSVWMDEVIPTIRKMIDLRDVDEACVIGPAQFTEHIKEKIEMNFPKLDVFLGDTDVKISN